MFYFGVLMQYLSIYQNIFLPHPRPRRRPCLGTRLHLDPPLRLLIVLCPCIDRNSHLDRHHILGDSPPQPAAGRRLFPRPGDLHGPRTDGGIAGIPGRGNPGGELPDSVPGGSGTGLYFGPAMAPVPGRCRVFDFYRRNAGCRCDVPDFLLT